MVTKVVRSAEPSSAEECLNWCCYSSGFALDVYLMCRAAFTLKGAEVLLQVQSKKPADQDDSHLALKRKC